MPEKCNKESKVNINCTSAQKLKEYLEKNKANSDILLSNFDSLYNNFSAYHNLLLEKTPFYNQQTSRDHKYFYVEQYNLHLKNDPTKEIVDPKKVNIINKTMYEIYKLLENINTDGKTNGKNNDENMLYLCIENYKKTYNIGSNQSKLLNDILVIEIYEGLYKKNLIIDKKTFTENKENFKKLYQRYIDVFYTIYCNGTKIGLHPTLYLSKEVPENDHRTHVYLSTNIKKQTGDKGKHDIKQYRDDIGVIHNMMIKLFNNDQFFNELKNNVDTQNNNLIDNLLTSISKEDKKDSPDIKPLHLPAIFSTHDNTPETQRRMRVIYNLISYVHLLYGYLSIIKKSANSTNINYKDMILFKNEDIKVSVTEKENLKGQKYYGYITSYNTKNKKFSIYYKKKKTEYVFEDYQFSEFCFKKNLKIYKDKKTKKEDKRTEKVDCGKKMTTLMTNKHLIASILS